jgi:hypothetical protein
MFGALTRAAERWKSIKFSEFERRQLSAVEKELDQEYEAQIDLIFDLQDQVTPSVVGAIAPKLEQAEIERAKHKPTESLDAYDYVLRATAIR